jgi:hypothetical protein
LKRAYVAVFLIIACAAIVSGCASQAQYQKNATFGGNFYNFDKVHYWKNNVSMYANGVNATWNMTVHVRNNTLDGATVRYMEIVTEGNGMNITYDVWSNRTTYEVLKMHARGYIGDRFQDRDTSPQQIFTLPDVGLSYYFVPFTTIKNTTVKMPDGRNVPIVVYSASDNKGFSVTYWICPPVPVPVKVEMSDKNFRITETLIEYG